MKQRVVIRWAVISGALLLTIPSISLVRAATTQQGTKLDAKDESAGEILRRIRQSGKNSNERATLHRQLRQYKIETASELDVLVEAAKDDEIGAAALTPIEELGPTASDDVKSKLVALIDVDDESKDLRVLRTVLKVAVKNNLPGAKERIRGRLSREPKTRLRTPDDLKRGWADNWRKGKRIGRVQELARALIVLGDKESIPKIFELDEVLATGSAGSMMAPFGKDGVVYAAAQCEKEEGLRKDGCLAVVAMADSKESVPELKRLLQGKNAPLRRAALEALIRIKPDDLGNLLKAAATDSDDKVKRLALNQSLRQAPLENRAEIERQLASKDPREQLAVLQLLAGSPPKGMENTLENFIKQDEAVNPGNPMLRFYAAKALWKLTGRKVEYSRGEATYKPYPWDGAP